MTKPKKFGFIPMMKQTKTQLYQVISTWSCWARFHFKTKAPVFLVILRNGG